MTVFDKAFDCQRYDVIEALQILCYISMSYGCCGNDFIIHNDEFDLEKETNND